LIASAGRKLLESMTFSPISIPFRHEIAENIVTLQANKTIINGRNQIISQGLDGSAPSSYIVGIYHSFSHPYYQRSKPTVLDMELVFTTAFRWDLSLGSFRSYS
jgi:hypothetical protein